MTTAVKIIYSDYIPDELIQDFVSCNLKNELNGEIQVIKNENEYENFNGPEFSDIVIYVEQHITEILISGVLGNTAFSVFKYSITRLWAGFMVLIKKRRITKAESQMSITIDLHVLEKDVEIVLRGDIQEKDLEKIVDKVFDFLQSRQLTEAFKNADNIENLMNKPKIRLVYNEETKKWEPRNFGKLRRQFEELRNWGSQNILD